MVVKKKKKSIGGRFEVTMRDFHIQLPIGALIFLLVIDWTAGRGGGGGGG